MTNFKMQGGYFYSCHYFHSKKSYIMVVKIQRYFPWELNLFNEWSTVCMENRKRGLGLESFPCRIKHCCVRGVNDLHSKEEFFWREVISGK